MTNPLTGSPEQQLTRMSDMVMEGIYYFGGKNQKGELVSKLKYLKPTVVDGKVVSAEWTKIKQQGIPPCGRIGHSMSFLPINNCLIVVGGRNDMECQNKNIPFLNDMHLFLLDQKSWLKVQYIPDSPHLCMVGNHSSCVMTDNETFEKIIIFGGISNYAKQDTSALTN